MSETGLIRYVLSCGLLTVPILVWNLALTRFLPPALASHEFSRDIPALVTYGENTLRIAVMALPRYSGWLSFWQISQPRK